MRFIVGKDFNSYDFQTKPRNGMVVPTSPWLRSHKNRERVGTPRRDNRLQAGRAVLIGFNMERR